MITHYIHPHICSFILGLYIDYWVDYPQIQYADGKFWTPRKNHITELITYDRATKKIYEKDIWIGSFLMTKYTYKTDGSVQIYSHESRNGTVIERCKVKNRYGNVFVSMCCETFIYVCNGIGIGNYDMCINNNGRITRVQNESINDIIFCEYKSENNLVKSCTVNAGYKYVYDYNSTLSNVTIERYESKDRSNIPITSRTYDKNRNLIETTLKYDQNHDIHITYGLASAYSCVYITAAIYVHDAKKLIRTYDFGMSYPHNFCSCSTGTGIYNYKLPNVKLSIFTDMIKSVKEMELKVDRDIKKEKEERKE
jgi:hypothetical protein